MEVSESKLRATYVQDSLWCNMALYEKQEKTYLLLSASCGLEVAIEQRFL